MRQCQHSTVFAVYNKFIIDLPSHVGVQSVCFCPLQSRSGSLYFFLVWFSGLVVLGVEGVSVFDVVKTLVAALAMPLPVAVALMVVGVLLGWVGWRRAGRLSVSVGVLVIVLAAWNPVADRLLAPIEAAHAPLSLGAAADDAAIVAVVVLGGGWAPHPPWPASTRLNESSLHRLTEGLRVLQRFPDAQLIVTGTGRAADAVPIALGYAEAAVALGVAPERIVALRDPTDTALEAYAVREHLGTDARFVLVTSASHMRRAVRHFERAGLTPIASPTQFLTGRDDEKRLSYWVPSAQALRKTERAVYETLGWWALELDHRGR